MRPGRRRSVRVSSLRLSFSLLSALLIGQHAVADYSTQSLYSGPAPRPGPDILYKQAPRAPQLENVGIWKADPILVSGAAAYRRGEFLYQDYLYDDTGANGTLPDATTGARDPSSSGSYSYPTHPDYAGNAADLVEFRVKKHGQDTVFRITLNSLLAPQRVALTLAIGESAAPVAFPHGANASAPAELFLTWHGNEAELIDAATGQALSPAPQVRLDTERRQIELRVPAAAWEPGERVIRFAGGVGLWDERAGRYTLPAETAGVTTPGGKGLLSRPTAFFNAAFRFEETGNWRDGKQAEALSDGDLSELFVQVDFAKLKRGVTDDLLGQPKGVPKHGPMNRILASHSETRQGADWNTECGDAAGCVGSLLGQLQPYSIYVPVKPEPEGGYGLTLLLHSLGQNYNQYSGNNHQSQLGERGQGHIVITPAGRGPDGWYVEHAGADTFEVWADVARRYRLNPAMTNITGYSMGGYATYRFTTRFPDLFAKAHTVVGPPSIGIWAPPLESTGGEESSTYSQLESVRNIPYMMWIGSADELVPITGTTAQAQRFDELGYRYRFDTYATSDHLLLAINDEYGPSAEFLGDATVDRDPHHVSYVVNPAMDFANVGMVGDHAYWLSELTVRDPYAQTGRAKVDAVSHGFGLGDPVANATRSGVGVLQGGTLGPMLYTTQYKTWGSAPSRPVANKLSITARNLATMTVHIDRAKLGCDAQLDVDTDGPLTVTLAGCGRQESFR